MRDEMPSHPLDVEMGIVNLDATIGSGTHWVCYSKRGNLVNYFDSFGNLRPPEELNRYFGKKTHVFYNYSSYQLPDTVVCGHLCLLFLANENSTSLT